MIDLAAHRACLEGVEHGTYRGRVTRAVGTLLEAEGIPAAIGDVVLIERADRRTVEAEVLGVRGKTCLLMPSGSLAGISMGSEVVPLGSALTISVTSELLGRVVDAQGRPIDEGPAVEAEARLPLQRECPPALERPEIDEPLWTGVRAIDALCTLGRGQRIGIFSGSGIGKSTLLAQVARGCTADAVVLALIGERNREVHTLLRDALPEADRQRAVAVVATSDRPPLERHRAAFTAVTIAEHLRDQGRDVLLVMDSVTRFAAACREIGLATGEVSTVRGYTPSFFATVPRLVERLGRTRTGSITGIFTVLIDADSMDDPVGDTLRGLLDGHLMLDRELARRGRFPAIDPLESLSRLMDRVATREHLDHARALRGLLAELDRHEDLVQIGAYKAGTNPRLDRALERRERIEAFLSQRGDETSDPQRTRQDLEELVR